MKRLTKVSLIVTLFFSIIDNIYALNNDDLINKSTNINIEKYPDADAVLIQDDTTVIYQLDGTSKTHTSSAIKILTEKGKRKNRILSLSFNISYGTNYFTKVNRITSKGKLIPIDISANSRLMVNPSQMNANIYNPNSKVLRLSVPGLQIGDILTFSSCDIVTKPVVPNTWSDYQVFEADFPIISASYTIDAPKELPLKKIILKDEIPGTVTHSISGKINRILYKWNIKDVPQFFPESNMPNAYTVTQRLLISTIENWEDLSKWYWDLCLPRMQCTTAEMVDKAKELADGKNHQEIIKSMFNFVSQDIRYMGITTEEEAPGYEPHDVSITFENRYGVCRDKAALLASMLRIVGIDAFPVIIMVGPKKDEEVPQPFFNHAVTAALDETGEYVLMDPTDENTKDIFPTYLQNMSYLVARPEGETLKTSPVIPAEKNMTQINNQGYLNAQGQLSAQSIIHFNGINDTVYRAHFSKLKPEELQQFFESHLKSSSASAILEDIKFYPNELRDTSKPLKVELKYKDSDVLTNNEGLKLIQIPYLGNSIGYANFILDGTGLKERRFPLYTRITAGIKEIYEIDIDPKLGTPIIPNVKATETEDLCWSRTYSKKDNILSITNNFELKTVQFSTNEYKRLKRDLENIEYESRKKLFIKTQSNLTSVPDILTLNEEYIVKIVDSHNWNSKFITKFKVLTYAGKKDYSEIQLYYNPIWENISVTNARVTLPDGTVKNVRPEEVNIMDASWCASAPRYPAEKILVVNLPGVEVGSIIEYEVNTKAFDQSFYHGIVELNDFDPIEKTKIEIHMPKSLNHKKEAKGCNISESIKDQMHVISLKDENQTTVLIEEDLPPWHTFNPYLIITTSDWKSYVNQINKELKRATTGQDEARALARELTKNISNKHDRIRALRDWVFKNIRPAGPHFTELPLKYLTSADTTLSHRYGNHADRMILLYSLLKSAGIHADWYLCNTDSVLNEVNEIYDNFPSTTHFTMFVLKIIHDGKPLYLTGNSNYSELGTTVFDQHPILSIKSGEIEKIEIKDILKDLEQEEINLTLKNNGDLIYDYLKIDQGVNYEDYKKMWTEMTPELRRRFHEELITTVAENAVADGELITEYDKYPGRTKFRAKASRYAVIDDQYMYCSIYRMFDGLLAFESSNRINPYDFDYWYDEKMTLNIKLPEQYELVSYPHSFEWHGPKKCGVIKIDSFYNESNHSLSLKGIASLRSAIIPKHQYNHLLQGERELSHPDRRILILKKKIM